MNLSISAVGSLKVELQDEAGRPIPGFTLGDSVPSYGDSIDLPIKWANDRNLSATAGRPVRLRLVLQECDLYSFRFH